MEHELSLIRFCCYNYFATIMNSRPFQPISTLLIKLVEALLDSEPVEDKKAKARLNWIYVHTSEQIDAHLSVVELIVFRNLDKGVSKEVEIGEKTFYLSELYYVLDNISKELTSMVISIAKKYSVDIPMVNFNTNSKQNFEI